MTVSGLERLGVRKRLYFGLQMYNLTPEIQPEVTVTFSVNMNRKLVQKGVLSFDRHEKSCKFDDEVVISVWSRSPPISEDRAFNAGYYRVEIPVPLK